jgi:hypothetical protein
VSYVRLQPELTAPGGAPSYAGNLSSGAEAREHVLLMPPAFPAPVFRKEGTMPVWFRTWFENQKQTRKFHPSWIVMVVIVTIVVGSIIWVLAALVAKSDALSTRPPGATQTGGRPAMIERIPRPPDPERETIWVDFRQDAGTHVASHVVRKT